MSKGKAIRDAVKQVRSDHAEAYYQREQAKAKEPKKGASFAFYMFVACLLTWAAYSYGFTMGGL